jgi:hypothetical protein
MDIPMRHCSVSVDGRPMTVKGEVVGEGQKAKRSAPDRRMERYQGAIRPSRAPRHVLS